VNILKDLEVLEAFRERQDNVTSIALIQKLFQITIPNHITRRRKLNELVIFSWGDWKNLKQQRYYAVKQFLNGD
jgi:hypothetical protein